MKALLIALSVAFVLGAQAAPAVSMAGGPTPVVFRADGAQGDTSG